jgi:hypothetical protein
VKSFVIFWVCNVIDRLPGGCVSLTNNCLYCVTRGNLSDDDKTSRLERN